MDGENVIGRQDGRRLLHQSKAGQTKFSSEGLFGESSSPIRVLLLPFHLDLARARHRYVEIAFGKSLNIHDDLECKRRWVKQEESIPLVSSS